MSDSNIPSIFRAPSAEETTTTNSNNINIEVTSIYKPGLGSYQAQQSQQSQQPQPQQDPTKTTTGTSPSPTPPSYAPVPTKDTTTKTTTTNMGNGNSRPLLNNRDRNIAWGVLGGVVLITAVVLIALSLKKLSTTEQGLQYTKRTKQLAEAASSGGLHAGPPGFTFVKFPSVQITEDLEPDVCLSKDGLRIGYRVTFQYVMPPTWLHPAVLKYRNFERWAELVAVAGNSAIQHTCSDFIVTDFQNQRAKIQNQMMENLQLALEGPERDGASGVYAQAISVSLRNIDLPVGYTNAIAQKEEAAQDIELAINQRSQETTKARTQLLSAQEEAVQILDTARNDANITLTRANLKASETLFALETEAAILVRAKEGLGLTTTDGLLGYMSNRLYSQVPNLKVTTGEPAKISRKDEL